MSQLAIDQLPDLCLRRIFAFLSLRDLSTCKAVCRLFKFYADQVAVRELVVRWLFLCDDPCRWYLTDKPIEWEDAISPNAFESLQRSPLQVRQQLKFLHIHSFEDTNSNFQFLNACEQLIHLEIYWWQDYSPPNFECTLANLRLLSLGHSRYPPLVLKTPRLEALQCKHLESIGFEYPETIKKLECDYNDTNAIVLAKFKNLEAFKCDIAGGVLDRVLQLAVCKPLKELNLRLNWRRIKRGSFETFRSSLTNLLSTSANSKSGEELKIYFDDVRLLDASQLGDYDDLTNGNFLFKN